MVFAYVYFTRIIVYLVRATMPCKYGWVSKSTSEAATLSFFLVAGFKFRPRLDNPYLKVCLGALRRAAPTRRVYQHRRHHHGVQTARVVEGVERFIPRQNVRVCVSFGFEHAISAQVEEYDDGKEMYESQKPDEP